MRCRFNHCKRDASPSLTKCQFHRKRSPCAAPGCTNQSVANHLCVRHGGKRTCQMDGCDAPTRGRKKCPAHGGIVPKRYCSEVNCGKQAHANHKCVAHGGGRYCKVDGCQCHIRSRGLCRVHLAATDADHPQHAALEAKSEEIQVDPQDVPSSPIVFAKDLDFDPELLIAVDDILAACFPPPQWFATITV
ncbi:Aste57867_19102 [Aphanomyces stellatus]|uniref:Aste57867_19102 protein n=1 Tax=Aphanomyces stellatus TaxID=120398 RepID=A0A485LCE4_9STRA|nr:hypothetical protein As57867_019038 [Aphanomyces stellatus]VFT95826.1 Aste57867_19102 [Aphanomyces stellatus]